MMPDSTVNAAHLIIWAMQARPGLLLPRVKMLPSEVLAWIKEQALVEGGILEGWRPGSDGSVNWQQE
eukprot:3964852-Lingulodinium_polyedra.AAC.1